MSGWGAGWGNSPDMFDVAEEQLNIGIDIAKPGSDETVYAVWTAEGWKQLNKEEYENKFLNKHPTHDPYTNPNSHIYYECKCGAILDPGTKSFAALNNCASNAGWKVRWGADSYVPYCPKCGEEVE